MTILRLGFALVLAFSSARAGSTPVADKPVAVEILDDPAERRDAGYPVGNVRVRFVSGRAEVWTTLGRSLLPKVSPGGVVGWTWFRDRNDRGWLVNSRLRLRFPNGTKRDYRAFYGGPYIEDWGLADDETTVVIKSRGSHGPASFVKYEVATGKVLAELILAKVPFGQLPAWAQPFADDHP